MDNFDLKNYLAENKLLKENTLAGYYSSANKKVKGLANEIDTIIAEHPEQEYLFDKITDLVEEYAQNRENSNNYQ